MKRRQRSSNRYQPDRREYLRWTAAISMGYLAGQGRADEPEQPRDAPLPLELAGPKLVETQSAPWLRKTLKAGMARPPKGTTGNLWPRKMAMAAEAGFEGMEINTGENIDVHAAVEAAKEHGIVIDGTVGGYHWKVRHTDPNDDVRAEAMSLLTSSLQQTADLGATTFLIVPGHGKDGTPDEVRQRAHAAIEAVIPLAEKLGVEILIENVWNHFLYDHDGDEDQSAQPLADFIDSFGSPLVGCQFDLGNHWKYGDVADWVRTLDHRIRKLDIKGFSRASGRFCDITEGDIDWASVQSALVAIDFTGWLAAEVGGGNQARLNQVAAQMDAALECDTPMKALRKRIG
ncbi:MAG: sugar phosphate isomerase/epimerase family protein [Planctomycetota bacterium]